MRARARVHLVLASLLAVLLLTAASSPVAAAPDRSHKAERLAYRLVNCLRTGGKVTKAGRCRGYGTGRYSRQRRPLRYSDRISDRVSWPWARQLASTNSCTHELGRSSVDRDLEHDLGPVRAQLPDDEAAAGQHRALAHAAEAAGVVRRARVDAAAVVDDP